jgi:hypothetical protein
MKAFWIVLSTLILAALIVWVRAGAAFNLVHTLPPLGGKPPSLYWDGAAVAMIVIAINGVHRLRNRD